MPEGTVPGRLKPRLAGLAGIWAAASFMPPGPWLASGLGAAAACVLSRRAEPAMAAAGLGIGWLTAFMGWPYGLAAFAAAVLLWRGSGLRAQGAAVGLIYAVAASLMGPGGGAGMMRAWLEGLGWGPQAVDTTIFAFRKSIHVVGYGVLAAAAAWAIGPKSERRLAAAALMAVGTAVADEWIQSFSPGRTGQASDIAIDAVGIVLGLAVFSRWVNRRG